MARRRGATSVSGASSGVQIVGLPELRRELRKLDDPKGWTKELSLANRTIAKKAAAWAQSEASGMGGPQAHFARAIRGYGTVTGARIGINNGNANAAFWGAKKRTGWYARGRYSGSSGQQHERWIGNGWDVARRGQGPYAINASLADNLNRIVDLYGDAIDDITRRAFPD